MDIQVSGLFLLLIIAFLWDAKADLFFFAFGTAVLLYILIQYFFKDPLEVLLGTLNYLFLNPLGIMTLLIPLLIYGIRRGLKKIRKRGSTPLRNHP